MAGDWIKMRCNLDSDPAVIGIATMTGLVEDHVVGKLHRLWSWANSQSRDGNVASVTPEWIDRYLSTEGFAAAMISVGWLAARTNGIYFPNFERHMSESAKKRALTAKRVAMHKETKSNAPNVSGALPREEKRRGEKRRREKDPPSPQGGGTVKSEVLPAGFPEFWEAYPNKKAKPAAIRAWKRIAPDETVRAQILTAITWQMRSHDWTKENGRYIPHPATWLNNERWKDQMPAVRPHGGIAQWLEESQRDQD